MTTTCFREYLLVAERDRRAAIPPRDPDLDDDEEEEEDDEGDEDRGPAVIREPDEGE